MDETQSLKELRRAIDRMVRAKEKVVTSLTRDRAQLTAVDAKIEKATERYDMASETVEQLEGKVDKYADTIEDCEQALNKVSFWL